MFGRTGSLSYIYQESSDKGFSLLCLCRARICVHSEHPHSFVTRCQTGVSVGDVSSEVEPMLHAIALRKRFRRYA